MKKFLRIALAVSLIVMSLASVMGTAVSAEVSAADAVASVGTQYFASLSDALVAAQDGDTILVYKDTTIETTPLSGRNVIIKGVGTTKPVITSPASPAFKLLDSTKLTLENLAFTGYSNLMYYGAASGTADDDYSITLTNVDVSFKASGVIYGYAANRVDVTVTGCTFTAGASGNAIINPSIGAREACYVKFSNNTLNNGCLEVNAGAQGAVIKVKAPSADDMANSDAEAIAKGAVARIGETASGNIGEVYFTNLTEAVIAAKEGNTVYVIANVEGFGGATLTGKTIKLVGVQKYTITPSSASMAFTLNDGAGITIENLKFSGYDGTNLILFAKAGATDATYDITLKNTDVGFRASGAIYGYSCSKAVVTVENCSFSAGAAGNCILNFTNSSCYEECELNVTDTKLSENCGIASANAQFAVVNETYSTDVLAAAANVHLRVGSTEGGKVGEVYFRTIDAETLKGLASGTKLTVLCTCGAKKEITTLNCGTKVNCTCGVEIANLADHNYSEATCQKKATCADCNTEKGELAEHKYSEATCQKKATCEWCQAEDGELAGHDFSKATCEKKATCKVCGLEEGETLEHKDRDKNGRCDACDLNLNGDDTDAATDTTVKVDDTTANADDTNKADDTDKANEGGCKSSVTVAGLALVATLGTCAIFVEKKRR